MEEPFFSESVGAIIRINVTNVTGYGRSLAHGDLINNKLNICTISSLLIFLKLSYSWNFIGEAPYVRNAFNINKLNVISKC